MRWHNRFILNPANGYQFVTIVYFECFDVFLSTRKEKIVGEKIDDGESFLLSDEVLLMQFIRFQSTSLFHLPHFPLEAPD
jgi:hypothetical protein